MKRTVYRFILIMVALTIIAAVSLSLGFFHQTDMVIHASDTHIQMENQSKASVNNGVEDTNALLMLSAVAPMGAVVLWTLVNYRKE